MKFKPVSDLTFGFVDAENYRQKGNKEMFNEIFVKDKSLEKLMMPNTYFLIGEKGNGKTAYAVFLSNNEYLNTISKLKYVRETEYQKFVQLKKDKSLVLSDYTSIWKVIILLLISNSILEKANNIEGWGKTKKILAIKEAVDDFYQNAFSPEIATALNFTEDAKRSAEIVSKYFKASGESSQSQSFDETRYQINLLYIQNKFQDALADLKLKKNYFLFIDGIDIRPGEIEYSDYLECVKGLANAIWSLNNDFFSNIKDSAGRMKVVLLMRPDIFDSIGLQNQANKIIDNSVFLDWRTTYPEHRTSELFVLCDRLLSHQQDPLIRTKLRIGETWDHYFPWVSKSTNIYKRENDTPFIDFLRYTLSRPRDMITILIKMKESYEKNKNKDCFEQNNFENDDFKNSYSEYMMASIKDQISFYYTSKEYDLFLLFFSYLEGKGQFSYKEYRDIHSKFEKEVKREAMVIPEFINNPDRFLQFLYDNNILCYYETFEGNGKEEQFVRWCYRERNSSNISPKVKYGSSISYIIHSGLHKKLNIGRLIKNENSKMHRRY